MTVDDREGSRYITIANTKGGVGKTTTAILLAEALARRASVEVRDCDPQGSATEWVARARDGGEEVPFLFTVANQRSLSAPSEARWVIVDTPPGQAGIVEAAIARADFVIIPTEPTAIAIDRMWTTLDVTNGTPRAVLITRAFAHTKNLESVTALLDGQELPRFETIIWKREAIARAFGHLGEADLYGYEAVATEVEEALS